MLPPSQSGWEKLPGMVTGTPLTLPSGRIFRIQIPGAEREHASDRKVLNAASVSLTVFFRAVLVKNVYRSVRWRTFAALPARRARQEVTSLTST